MTALAAATGAVNLGQGFPDTDGPPEVREAAIDAIRSGQNQYPPGMGVAPLRHAIAAHQERFYDLAYDPEREVLVTTGATEGIAAALLALCEPGDEVLTFEPYYDSYAACIAMAGGSRRVVTLRAPEYAIELDELRGAVTSRTRLVLLNSPHNPTGKVFGRAELEQIAAICVEHDLIVITDEVYEHLVFDGEHIPIATLPGMRDRTLTISSGGKTFSFTGWKVGWVCGPEVLLRPVQTVKQYLTYASGTPFQYAIAVGLALGDDYYRSFVDGLRAKRDRLAAGLRGVGLEVFPSAGTYFLTADVRSIGESDGMAFCRALPERCGVVAVPNVVFYDNETVGRPLVRFTFCKRDAVLDEAIERMGELAR